MARKKAGFTGEPSNLAERLLTEKKQTLKQSDILDTELNLQTPVALFLSKGFLTEDISRPTYSLILDVHRIGDVVVIDEPEERTMLCARVESPVHYLSGRAITPLWQTDKDEYFAIEAYRSALLEFKKGWTDMPLKERALFELSRLGVKWNGIVNGPYNFNYYFVPVSDSILGALIDSPLEVRKDAIQSASFTDEVHVIPKSLDKIGRYFLVKKKEADTFLEVHGWSARSPIIRGQYNTPALPNHGHL